MPRLLVCMDEVPASDGTCAVQSWQEVQTSVVPELSKENVQELAPWLAVLLAAAWAWKIIGRQLK